MSFVADTGLFNIAIEDVQFPGGFGDDVAKLRSNKGKPIIVQELEDGYRLIDGWGRVSGMINAGREEIQAILVSDADIAERIVSGDDEEWNAAMYARYAPKYTYPGTTN